MKILLFITLALFTKFAASQNNAPVIGIVTVPSDYDEYPESKFSYFYASYVKYLEQAGARVVPIQYDLPQKEIRYLLDSLNGVLITGGSADFVDESGEFTEFGASLNFIHEYIVNENKNGKYYPLWGTCMGFQAIVTLTAKNFTILTRDCKDCVAVNKNNFFNPKFPDDRLHRSLSTDLKEKMTYANLSLFAHNYMFHAHLFEDHYPLNVSLNAITFSYDARGAKYVSSFESPDMPIYGTQFHPEKNAFEWRTGYEVNRGYDPLLLQEHYANFFVGETRKNNNYFADVGDYIIDNYNTVILLSSTASHMYFFPRVNAKHNLRGQTISI